MIDTHGLRKARGWRGTWCSRSGCPRTAGAGEGGPCGGIGVGWGPGLLPALGVLLRELLALHLLRILSGAGLASPRGGQWLGGWRLLCLRLPHNSCKVKKEVKGLWNFRPSYFKKKWNFHLIQVNVPSQTFSSANDRNSLNSVYRDLMLRQSVSRQCSFYVFKMLICCGLDSERCFTLIRD